MEGAKGHKFLRVSESLVERKQREGRRTVVYEEDFDEETTTLRKFCISLHDPIWYNFVVIMGLINISAAFLIIIAQVSEYPAQYTFVELFYFADMVWFLNVSLSIYTPFIKNLKTTHVMLPRRKPFCYAIDILAMLPFELVTPSHIGTYLLLNRSLKIVYVYYIFHFENSNLRTTIVMRLLQMLYKMIFYILAACLGFAVIQRITDSHHNYDVIKIIHVVTDHMTGRGFGLIAHENYLSKLLLFTAGLAFFIGILLIGTANITFLFFTQTANKSAFRYKFNCLKKQMHRKAVSVEFMNWLNVYFHTMWTHAGGNEEQMGNRRNYTLISTKNMLSHTLHTDVTIDMCLEIFKHSIILKDLPLSFLRDLSTFVTSEVYVQDQLVYKLYEMKDKLIYLFEGVVELISDEDGETPIMQFSAGSCFSETCLYQPYRSRFMVKCKTTCVFQILRHEDFLSLVIKHKGVNRQVRNCISSRYGEARVLRGVQSIWNGRADRKKKCTNMSWLVFMLHRLMAIAHPGSARRHTFSSLHMERYIDENNFRRHIFTPKYLQLYAVPEIAQEYKDTLFSKSKFPYMFNPNTGLILFWEIFIAMIALSAGLLIPYFVLVTEGKVRPEMYTVVYFFTGVWWLDLIIQLRIPEQSPRGRSLGSMDTIIVKLSSPIFVLDVISIIPAEIFASVFAYLQYGNYMYMNRILKLSRVMRLLWKWECRYNSNPLLVRFFCCTLFLIYSVFIVSCMLYNVGYLGNGGPVQFKILLFYTSQVLTGVCIWVDGYSDFAQYRIPALILFIGISLIYVIMYGLIFSAYAQVKVTEQHIKQRAKSLIEAAKKSDPRFENYIANVLHHAITMDNGFEFEWRGYIFNALPKELLGYMYETYYENIFDHFPIFAGLTPLIRREIFENSTYAVEFEAHEVIFHVGDLISYFYLLIRGHCQRIGGVHLDSKHLTGLQDLNSAEVSLMIPTRNAILTLTNCRLLCVDYKAMRRIILSHQKPSELRRPLSGFRDIRARMLGTQLKYFHPNLMDNWKTEVWMKSFVRFQRKNPTFRNEFRIAGIDKLRHFSMTLTIAPEGKFMKIWELIRCVCAILSSLLFLTTNFTLYEIPHSNGIIKWTLELMAYADIYIRFHVAYYNKHGLLVTHPSKTIIHYFKHGFVLDLLGALPLHLGVQKSNYLILNFNKIFQLHRYVSYLKYKDNNKIVPLNKIYMFAHIPTMMILINALASIMLLLNCSIDMSDPSNPSVSCTEDGLFDIKHNVPFESPLGAHIYAIYIVMSTISRIAVQGFNVVDDTNMLFIGILSFFAFCIGTLNGARVFSFYMNEYVELMHKDVQMHLLKNFLTHFGHTKQSTVLAQLLYFAERHVKRCWFLDEGNVHKQIDTFPVNLKRDILYNHFGPVLTNCCLPGSKDIKAFMRNILLHSEYKIIDKNGFVQLENDICGYTIIVYRGIVMMVSETYQEKYGSVLRDTCISLGPGSIIGNLCPMKYNRLDVSIAAMGVLELLYIETNTFFEILQHFPSSSVIFRRLRTIHGSHIPGSSQFHYPNVEIAMSKWKINQDPTKGLIAVAALNIFGGYLPQFLYFYDVIIVNINWTYYPLLCDVCFVAGMVLVFFLKLTNVNGDPMSVKMIINQFYLKWIFYVTILSAIPFYTLIPYPHFDDMIGFYLYAVLRANVVLRNFFFFRVLRSPSLIFVGKLIWIIMIIFLAICGTAAFLVVVSEINNIALSPDSQTPSMRTAPLEEKLTHLVNYLYVVTNLFTHMSQALYFPMGSLYVTVFIILMSVSLIYISMFYSMVVSIVQAIYHRKSQYLSTMNAMVATMVRHQMSTVLVDRIHFHCAMIWRTCKGAKMPELFLGLPAYLREPMCEHIFGKMLESHFLFQQVHVDLKRQLYAKLKMDYFHHGDYIVYEGTIDQTMYFVLRGTVVMLHGADGGGEVLSTLGEQASFGVAQGVVEDAPHQFSYRALTDAVVLFLAKRDWEHMLTFFPASKQIVESIVDHLISGTKKLHQD